ncbi:MAG: hypothetical protein HY460_03260, partial [Parcubacteria group bacterium]|nr:hypothetical protein [Parcubacteria group bacterium]
MSSALRRSALLLGFFTILFLGSLLFIVSRIHSLEAQITYTVPAKETIYAEWKRRFVTAQGAGAGGLRVQMPEDNYNTVSEGQGYGLLLAVFNNDRATFDALWNYTKRYRDTRGLMHWRIDRYGAVTGKNAATDGDEDIAFALLAASKKWNAYTTEARNYIAAIYAYEVEAGTFVLKPGDVWGGSDATNPSYFAPAYYKEFARFTGNTGWIKVADKSYEILRLARNASTGLVPEWTTAQGTSATRITWNASRDNFSYNAVRTPWRIALDWSWNSDPRAYDITNTMTRFF